MSHNHTFFLIWKESIKQSDEVLAHSLAAAPLLDCTWLYDRAGPRLTRLFFQKKAWNIFHLELGANSHAKLWWIMSTQGHSSDWVGPPTNRAVDALLVGPKLRKKNVTKLNKKYLSVHQIPASSGQKTTLGRQHNSLPPSEPLPLSGLLSHFFLVNLHLLCLCLFQILFCLEMSQ